MDRSGAESEAEEAEEKIRGNRNPARGREKERGSSLNTTVGRAASNNQQNRFHSMERRMESSEWMAGKPVAGQR